MGKVKQTIFVVLILVQICCLLAAGDDKKGGSKKASKGTGEANTQVQAQANNDMVQSGIGSLLKSSFMPTPLKVAVVLGKASWEAYNSYRDGAGITEVAKASLDSTISAAADVYSSSGGKALKIGYDAFKDISRGEDVKAVLQKSGTEMIKQHIPAYEMAMEAYLFIEEAQKIDKDSVLTQLINKGGEEAKKQLRSELRKRYGDQMDTFIDLAINTAMEAKDDQSAENLAKTFIKCGSEVIDKQQEKLFPDLKKAIGIAARVRELVEGGMSYQDAVKAEAVEAAKKHLINDDLKKKIEKGTQEANKIAEKANELGITNAVLNAPGPQNVLQWVKHKVEKLHLDIPGAWPESCSESDEPPQPTLKDGADVAEVAKASLESTIAAAADVYLSSTGSKALKIGYDAFKDISNGEDVKIVLQKSGTEMIKQHLPAYELAEKAYLFIEEAQKNDKDSMITQLINKGGEEAKKQLRSEMKKRYGDQSEAFIDLAINTAVAAKGDHSAENLAKAFIKCGTDAIKKQQEALFPDLKKAIGIAAKVNKRLEGGMSYQDAVKAEAVEAGKQHLINDDLKKKIEKGTEEVNKILKKANDLGITNAVFNVPGPQNVLQWVKQRVEKLHLDIPGAWPESLSESDEPPSKNGGKGKAKKK